MCSTSARHSAYNLHLLLGLLHEAKIYLKEYHRTEKRDLSFNCVFWCKQDVRSLVGLARV